MRLRVTLDDALLAEVKAAAGVESTREVIQLALETLLRLRRQAEIRDLRGQIQWSGDLDESRIDS